MTSPKSAHSQYDIINLERWARYSLALNILLVALHSIIAISSGSLAVRAELTHNVVDFLASLAVLFGIRIANRKSQRFPYGFYKVENLLAVGVSALIFISAYEILQKAIFSQVVPVQTNTWMLFMLLGTTVLPLIFSHFEMRVAVAANSPALIADAKEYRVHMYTTGLALLVLFLHKFPFPLDRIAAMIIVLVVLKTGWELLRDAMRVLLDASLDHDTLTRINQAIDLDPAVSKIKWLTGRNAGRFRFVEAGLILRVSKLEKVEKVLHRIESNIRMGIPYLERVILHVEASDVSCLRYAIPLFDHDGAISRHFGKAPYYAIVTLNPTNIDDIVEEKRIINNPHQNEETAKGIRVAEWLVMQKIDVVLITEDISNKGPEYIFRDAGIILHSTEKTTLAAVLSDECTQLMRIAQQGAR